MARVGRGNKTVTTLSSREVREITDTKQLETLYKRAYKQSSDRLRRAKQQNLEGIYYMASGFEKPLSLTQIKKKVKEYGYNLDGYLKNQLVALYRSLEKNAVSQLKQSHKAFVEDLNGLFDFTEESEEYELLEHETGKRDFWNAWKEFAKEYEDTVDGTGEVMYQHLQYMEPDEKADLFRAINDYAKLTKDKELSKEQKHKIYKKLYKSPFDE